MSKKLTTCKVCGQEIAKNAKVCPNCGARNKQPILKKWWLWVLIVAVVIVIVASGKETDHEKAADDRVDTAQSTNLHTEQSAQPEQNDFSDDNMGSSAENKPKEPAKTEYYVGDVIEDGNTRIVFMASGDYVEDNSFMQPADGNKYIYLQFAFENISKTSDTSISTYSFACYADGYAAEKYYGGEDDLSATLSAGRATTGYLYFEVPTDAQEIEVEYETNIFTEKKIKFIFEGEKDSGYVQQLNTTPSEDAHQVGDVVTSSKLKITYLSCEEYVSDNMFVVPAEGCHFITCEFEFENVGDSDEYVSSFSFDCYADGINCEATYIRDDNLSATLSAGRKTRGTVTFEVPIDAAVVEVEFLSNYWTSKRVVFTAN